LPEWLYEEGIGETRAILVADGEIVEAAIELPDAICAGAVVDARVTSIPIPFRRAILTLGGGAEALLEPVPKGITEGRAVRAEILRAPIGEKGRVKRAKVRLSDAELRDGPSLGARIAATGQPVIRDAFATEDRFEQAGWSELLEQAETGEIPFDGGALRMSIAPAMTLFDVDGTLPPPALAIAGAAAAGRAIRRLSITGSIGIDLPTLAARVDRQAAAQVLDDVLPQPFERTAVNGFGFLQLVRRRERESLAELIQNDRVGAAARALLRRAERSKGAGARTLLAAPPVIARIEAQSAWLSELSRRLGTAVDLRADPALAISAGHVQSAFA
jgi:hypothetical protein